MMAGLQGIGEGSSESKGIARSAAAAVSQRQRRPSNGIAKRVTVKLSDVKVEGAHLGRSHAPLP